MYRNIKHEIKKGVSFYTKQNEDERTAGIYMLVTFNSKRVRLYTHCRCNDRNWCKKTRRLSVGKDKDKINILLNDYENIVLELFSEYEHYPTIEKVRNDILARITMPEKPQSLYERFDEYIAVSIKKKAWATGTTKRAKVVKNHLYSFDTDLSFHDLTESKLLSFVEYLQNIPLVNTTIQKNIKTLAQFLNWATKEGYNKNDAYKTFDLKLKGTSGKSNEPIVLSWDELMTVYHLNIPETKNYLKQVRDVFVFMCFTGLRYSDVYNLRRYNIKEEHIEIVTIKTEQRIKINLNAYSRAIIDKYKDIPFKDDKALPVISNQKMNEYLKELGDLSGFTQKESIVRYIGNEAVTDVMPKSELLSTHTGRRTFVSNGSYLKIPYEVMASWTGHRSEAMMSRYRKISDNTAKTEMEKMSNI